MKVSFLFGSGADTCANPDLKSGASFSQALMTDGFKNERAAILGEQLSQYRLVHPQSKKVFIQTIQSNRDIAKGLFDNEILDLCDKYSGYRGKNHSEVLNEAELKVLNQRCKDWYSMVTKDNVGNAEQRDFFLKYGAFFDSLDEKFNTLRNAKDYTNAKRVINAYLTVFLLMFKSTYNIPQSFEWSYDCIFNYLHENSCTSLKCDPSAKTYYELLRDSSLDANIITTNYTDLARSRTGRDVVHLHGKLTWVEDLEKLTVYDCTEDAGLDVLRGIEDKHVRVVPFILIPSGVKPLICRRQICEFGKFVNALSESCVLCVVGYRFNSEDNHINSIIADWLRDDMQHRLLYLNYCQSGSPLNLRSLTWLDGISVMQIDFSPERYCLTSAENQIIDIKVDKNTAIDAFEHIIRDLEG